MLARILDMTAAVTAGASLGHVLARARTRLRYFLFILPLLLLSLFFTNTIPSFAQCVLNIHLPLTLVLHYITILVA